MSYLFRIDFGDLVVQERCGSGTYGSVYRSLWKSADREVAVKKLLTLGDEADILSKISHRNIVQFYGVVSSPPNYCVVMEYARHGSLFDYIRIDTEKNCFKTILQWSKEVALGMNYLHNEAPVKVIHRDLKSKNVVISDDFVCKICDFGSSRFMGSTTKMSLVGTYPWMAPEVIQSKPSNEACDTWSFGVVLWEIITREIPFDGIPAYQLMWLVVNEGKRLTVPSTCPEPFAQLMTSCWQTEPKDRPSFKYILSSLDRMLDDVDLKIVTEEFLAHKDVWGKEIEETVEKLKRQEAALTAKDLELREKERLLNARTQELERQFHVVQLDLYNVNTWRDVDVSQWISTLGNSTADPNLRELQRYAQLFTENNITGKRLLELESHNLREIGITSLGHLKDLMREIGELKVTCHRHQNFPPLRKIEVEQSLESATVVTRSFVLALSMGCHYKPASKPEDVKWMPYLLSESEDDSFDESLYIHDVTLYSNVKTFSPVKFTKPPYQSSKWHRGISPGMLLQCVIIFTKAVEKPDKVHLELKLDPSSNAMVEEDVKMTVKTLLRVDSSDEFTGQDVVDSSVLTRRQSMNRNESSSSLIQSIYSSGSAARQPEVKTWASVASAKPQPAYRLQNNGSMNGITSMVQVPIRSGLKSLSLRNSSGSFSGCNSPSGAFRSRAGSTSSNASSTRELTNHFYLGSPSSRIQRSASDIARAMNTASTNSSSGDNRDSGIVTTPLKTPTSSSGSKQNPWITVTHKKPVSAASAAAQTTKQSSKKYQHRPKSSEYPSSSRGHNQSGSRGGQHNKRINSRT